MQPSLHWSLRMLSPEVCEAVLKDHFKNPRHHGLKECVEVLEMENPSCGDLVSIGHLPQTQPIQWRFEGRGCAVSQAGTSLILQEIQRRALNPSEALVWLDTFEKELREGSRSPEEGFEDYEEAAALWMFRSIPSRLVCACMGIKLLRDRLQQLP